MNGERYSETAYCMVSIGGAIGGAPQCPDAKRRRLSVGMASTAASLHGNRARCAPDLLLQPQLQPPSHQPPLDRQQQLQSPRTVTTNSAMSSSGCRKRHHVRHSLPYSAHTYDNDAAASGQLPWNALPAADQAVTCHGGGGHTLDDFSSYGYSCDFGSSCTCNSNSSGSWQHQLQRPSSSQQRSVSNGSLLPITCTMAVSTAGGYRPLESSPNRTCTSGGTTSSLSRTRSVASAVPPVHQQHHQQPYHSHHQHPDPQQYHQLQYRQQQQQQPLQHQHPVLVFTPSADGPAAADNSSNPQQPLGGLYGSSDAAAAGTGNRPQPHSSEYEPPERPTGHNQPHGRADEHPSLGAFSHAIITTPSASSSARGCSAHTTQSSLLISYPSRVEAPCLPLHGPNPRGSLPRTAVSSGFAPRDAPGRPNQSSGAVEYGRLADSLQPPVLFKCPALVSISACEDGVPAAKQRPYLPREPPASEPPAWAPHPPFMLLLQQQHQQRKQAGSQYGGHEELVPPATPPAQGKAVQRMPRCELAEAPPLTTDAGSGVSPPPQPPPPPPPSSLQPLQRLTVQRAVCNAPDAPDASKSGPGSLCGGQAQQLVVHVMLRLSPVVVQQALLQPAGAQSSGGETAGDDARCSRAGLPHTAGSCSRAGHVLRSAAVSGAGIGQQAAGGARAAASGGPRRVQVAVEGEGQQGGAPCGGDGGSGGSGGSGGRLSCDPHELLASAVYGSVVATQGSCAAGSGPDSDVEPAAASVAPAAVPTAAAGGGGGGGGGGGLDGGAGAAAFIASAQRSGAEAHSCQPAAGCMLLATRRAPEPETSSLAALERRLEAATATATASVAAASAAIHAVPYPVNVLLARPPPDALPHVNPEPYFDPGGSLLQGAVLQTACHVIRLAQLHNHVTLLPPGRTTEDPLVVGEAAGVPGCGNAAAGNSGGSGVAAARAAPAPPASAIDIRRGVPVTAVLRLLTRFVSAASALEQAEAELLLAERCVVMAHRDDAVGDAGVGAGTCRGGGGCSQRTLPPGGEGGGVEQRGTAHRTAAAAVEARGALRALRPLMLRGREGAAMLLLAAERALA